MGKHKVTVKEISRFYERLRTAPSVRTVNTRQLRPGGGRTKKAGIYYHNDGPLDNQVEVDVVGGGCAQRMIVSLDVDIPDDIDDKARAEMASHKKGLLADLLV